MARITVTKLSFSISGPRGPPGKIGPKGDKGEHYDHGRNTTGSVTYVRWGRTSCPNTPKTEMIYAGMSH